MYIYCIGIYLNLLNGWCLKVKKDRLGRSWLNSFHLQYMLILMTISKKKKLERFVNYNLLFDFKKIFKYFTYLLLYYVCQLLLYIVNIFNVRCVKNTFIIINIFFKQSSLNWTVENVRSFCRLLHHYFLLGT